MMPARPLVFCAALAFAAGAHAQLSGPTNGIVAVVNNQVVTRYEMEKRLREKKIDLTNRTETDRALIWRQQINDRVLELLRIQATKEAGVSISEEQFINQRSQFLEQNDIASEEEFTHYLESQGLKESEFERNLRQNADSVAWLQITGGYASARGAQARPRFDVTVTAKEVKEYYDRHLEDEFKTTDRAKLHVIQIYYRRDNAAERTAKEREIRQIKIKLGTRADFAVLAAKSSQHPATKGEKGGDLGWIDPASDKLPEELVKLVFDPETKEADLLGPIEIGNSFWLVRVDKRQFEQTVQYFDAQEIIRKRISQEKFGRAIKRVQLELLRNSYIYPLTLKRELEDALEGR
jgi:parvulin-like peptidyl-prolyl isomerase